MSSDNTQLAEAINLSQPGATVLLPASDLAAILTEVNLSQIAQHPDVALRALVEVLQRQEKEIAVLKARPDLGALPSQLRSLQSEFDAFREQVAEDQAADRRRMKTLEAADAQPIQRDRSEVLRALLAASGGKMFAKDVRQKMGLNKNRFSELLSVTDDIDVKESHLDRRRLVLSLK